MGHKLKKTNKNPKKEKVMNKLAEKLTNIVGSDKVMDSPIIENMSRSIAQSIYEDKLNGMDADEAYHFLTVNIAKLKATFTEDDNHQMFDFADTSCLLFPINENTYTWFVRSLC